MKKAIVEISNKVLEGLLPPGSRILAVHPTDYRLNGALTFDITVEHPDFPECEEGVRMPYMSVEIKQYGHFEAEWQK